MAMSRWSLDIAKGRRREGGGRNGYLQLVILWIQDGIVIRAPITANSNSTFRRLIIQWASQRIIGFVQRAIRRRYNTEISIFQNHRNSPSAAENPQE